MHSLWFTLAKRPNGHCLHTALAALSATSPGWQREQFALAGGENRPRGQRSQRVRLSRPK